MKLTFSTKAWDNYLHWQNTDKKILKRINMLINDIQRTPDEGIGKPEPLKHGLASLPSWGSAFPVIRTYTATPTNACH